MIDIEALKQVAMYLAELRKFLAACDYKLSEYDSIEAEINNVSTFINNQVERRKAAAAQEANELLTIINTIK